MPTLPFAIPRPGHRPLEGRLEMPEGTTRGWALFAHCFTCGMDSLASVRITRALAALGIGTLRFDFAGIDTGDGPDVAADADDLKAAAAAMAAAGKAPSILIGHSLGGAAALTAAGDIASIAAVATIAAPFDTVRSPDRSLVDDLRAQELGARIEGLRRPLLILHGPLDQVVDIDNASRIFLAARHPKSFVSLDHADHLLSGKADADYAASLIAAWATRYLPPIGDTRDDGEADVIAEETGAGKYQVAIRAGGIRFIADEPVSVGGLGSGPGPYDLLSAGLAACTTMTLRLYAEQKGWKVDRIRTAVGHSRRIGHEPVDLFSARISIDGDISAEQHARLIEIADKCPVHRTLERAAKVETEVGTPPAPAEPIGAHADAMEKLVAKMAG